MSSLVPQSIENTIDYNLRDAPTIFEDISSKYQINKNIKKLVNLAQIQHTRLRMSFSKSIINDPHYEYCSIETTKHYLLKCHRYRQIREEMMNEILRYFTPSRSLNCVLLKDEPLNYNRNFAILLYRSISGVFKTDKCVIWPSSAHFAKTKLVQFVGIGPVCETGPVYQIYQISLIFCRYFYLTIRQSVTIYDTSYVTFILVGKAVPHNLSRFVI